MASIDLTPNPILIGGQILFFAANYLVVNNFLVKPYLALKMARDAETTDSLKLAKSLLNEAGEKQKRLDSELKSLNQELTADSEEKIAKMTAEVEKSIHEKKMQVTQELESLRNSLKDSYNEEILNLQKKVDQISEMLANRLLESTTKI